MCLPKGQIRKLKALVSKKKALVSRFKGILYDVDALNICISME